MERGRLTGSADRVDTESTDDGQHQTGYRQTGHRKVHAVVGAGRYSEANDRSDQPE